MLIQISTTIHFIIRTKNKNIRVNIFFTLTKYIIIMKLT